jgi:hypothetical protein
MLSAMLRSKPFRQRFGLSALAPMLLGLALTFRVSAVPVARAQAPAPNAAPTTQTAPAPPAPATAASVAPALPAPGPPAPPPPQAGSPQPGDELPSLAPSPLLGSAPAAAPSETDPRALTDFRPHLAPYGEWVVHPNFGLVWVPRRDVVGDVARPDWLVCLRGVGAAGSGLRLVRRGFIFGLVRVFDALGVLSQRVRIPPPRRSLHRP